MPEISGADHTHSPPILHIPRRYNAAHDLIERNLRAGRRDKLAFIDDDASITYQELDARTAAFANLLGSLGVQREQRVLLCMHDTIDLPVALLGAIRAGVVPIPVNTLLSESDYAYLIQDSGSSLVVVAAVLLPLIDAIRSKFPCLKHVLVAGGSISHPDSLTRRLNESAGTHRPADTCADDACLWLYSSGSTGPPKGTVHVHSSLIQTAELYARPILGIDASDICFSAAKLFFAYGLGNALTFPLAAGATAILMAERATPGAVFRRFAQHRPTVFGGVPTLYATLLASHELPAPSSNHLRCCTSAGEPLPEEIGRRWRRHFGIDILDGLGSTEMLHIFLSNRPDDVVYGTTGKPVPGYEVRLVDEAGLPVRRGEPGELHVSGPTSATHYWNNRARSRATFLGAWTRTGDKFWERQDGRFVYAGRSDDMLKVSGLYVSPAEVEAALIAHESVLEAAVVGREDKDGLTKPLAFVVVKDGVVVTEELTELLKRHVKSLLAPHKYPRWIEFTEDLPKTATGKIQRFKLRARAAGGSAESEEIRHTTIHGRRLEYRFVRPKGARSETIVFLHEGLGSIALWKDFPQRLAHHCGCNALVYSRHGHGSSQPLMEARRPDYMHREAREVLPELLDHLHVVNPVLFGHSDGASIALIHAAMPSSGVSGLIALAPHVIVEDRTIEGIRDARTAYQTTELPQRLARYHADADGTFWRWNDIWLHPEFRQWNIETLLPAIKCPVLGIQGTSDEYGTLTQLECLKAGVPHAQLLVLDVCRHSPQREQPQAVMDATKAFIGRIADGG